mgnify:CR=1 FL=1
MLFRSKALNDTTAMRRHINFIPMTIPRRQFAIASAVPSDASACLCPGVLECVVGRRALTGCQLFASGPFTPRMNCCGSMWDGCHLRPSAANLASRALCRMWRASMRCWRNVSRVAWSALTCCCSSMYSGEENSTSSTSSSKSSDSSATARRKGARRGSNSSSTASSRSAYYPQSTSIRWAASCSISSTSALYAA